MEIEKKRTYQERFGWLVLLILCIFWLSIVAALLVLYFDIISSYFDNHPSLVNNINAFTDSNIYAEVFGVTLWIIFQISTVLLFLQLSTSTKVIDFVYNLIFKNGNKDNGKNN